MDVNALLSADAPSHASVHPSPLKRETQQTDHHEPSRSNGHSSPSRATHPQSVDHPNGFSPSDAESRGSKRKLSGWTAPSDLIQPIIQHDRATPTDALFRKEEIQPPGPTPVPLPPVAVKAEVSPEPTPDISASSHRPLSHYARLGSRLPGSGDLGGSGSAERGWPCLPGVTVGVKRKRTGDEAEHGRADEMAREQEEEVVLEEECYSWTDLPMNKQGTSSHDRSPIPTNVSISPVGFRYIPCGPSPIPSPSPSHPFYRRVPALRAPFGTAEDTPLESPEPIQSSAVHLDWLDRSLYLKISPSAMTCTAEKGFRSVRGNVPVRQGAWYFECLILKGGGEGKTAVAGDQGGPALKGKPTGPVSERLGLGPGRQPPGVGTNGTTESSVTSPTQSGSRASNTQNPSAPGTASSSSSDGAHVRIGWARREAPVNGPCGLDAYSYGIRDATGEKVTLSRPKAYAELGGKGGFGTGDVVGCLISLPDRSVEDEDQSMGRREGKPLSNRDPVRKSSAKDEFDPSWIKRKRIPIRYKGQLYFESMEYTVPKEMEALVARDGRAMVPPADVNGEPSSVVAGQGIDSRAKSHTSPTKGKNDKARGKGKQAGKAVRKKAGGARRKRNEDRDYGEDSDEESRLPKTRTLPRLHGSKISFFLNGKPMASSPAFEDIFDFLPLRQTDAEIASQAALIKKLGALEASLRNRENPNDDGTLGYYPFISCFGGGKVQFHPGPNWMAPVDPMSWNLGFKMGRDGFQEPIVPRPLIERWQEFRDEETLYDRADEDELTELLRKERAAETAKKRVKTSGGSKASKSSTLKKASMAAALQASTPISRASSAVPSTSGSVPVSVSRPSAFLATMIQDRGTPGGTPAPDTPVHAESTQIEYAQSSPPKTATSVSSLGPGPTFTTTAPQPYPVYQREQTASGTSEDAAGDDDWSPLVSNAGDNDRQASDGPELPYGMEPMASLAPGTGQLQAYPATHYQRG